METRASRRRAAARERIVAEAMRLFIERGFDQVTVAEIAEAADVGKGTFFTHFPTKSDVFGYVGEQVSAQISGAIEAAPEAGAAERLRLGFVAAADWASEHRQLVEMMARSRTFNVAADLGSPNQQRVLEAVGQTIASGVATGEFRRDARVGDAAGLLLAGYLANVLAWALDAEESRSLHERLAAVVEIVVRGLQ